MTDKIEQILQKTTEALQNVPGVRAVVLGGSRARGTHTADSDIDVGVYYDAGTLDLNALQTAAQTLDDERRQNLIAPPGEWGAWVNGGGWLVVGGRHVDLILRDAARVRQVVGECEAGVFAPHYQIGHPHAYISAMYAGELAVSRLLWDGSGETAALKARAQRYPEKLRAALVRFFGFEAGFSCALAEKASKGPDLSYTTAHLVRAVFCLDQVLFALNRQYCINEKKAAQAIMGFAIRPQAYEARVRALFEGGGIETRCAILRELVDETTALSESE